MAAPALQVWAASVEPAMQRMCGQPPNQWTAAILGPVACTLPMFAYRQCELQPRLALFQGCLSRLCLFVNAAFLAELKGFWGSQQRKAGKREWGLWMRQGCLAMVEIEQRIRVHFTRRKRRPSNHPPLGTSSISHCSPGGRVGEAMVTSRASPHLLCWLANRLCN